MVICPKCHGDKKCLNDEFDSREALCRECDGDGVVDRDVNADAFCASCVRHIAMCACEVKHSWTTLEGCVQALTEMQGSEDEVRARLMYEWECAKSQGNICPEDTEGDDEETDEDDEHRDEDAGDDDNDWNDEDECDEDRWDDD